MLRARVERRDQEDRGAGKRRSYWLGETAREPRATFGAVIGSGSSERPLPSCTEFRSSRNLARLAC